MFDKNYDLWYYVIDIITYLLSTMSNIYKIAEIVGVSPATVSRALSNKGYVSVATKEKILKVAKELNYVPNSVARSLRSKRTLTLGVLIPNLDNPFYSSYVRGIQDVAELNNFIVAIFNTDRKVEKELSYLRIVDERKLEGVIVGREGWSEEGNEFLNYLVKKGIIVITIGHRIKNVDEVYVDTESGAYQATSYLLKLGYSRIAYIGAPLSRNIGIGRLKGYKKALLEWGIIPDESLIVEGDLTEVCGYNIIKDLWTKPLKPDGVLAANDLVAIGVILGARELDIKIPEELGIIGFDNIRESALIIPSLTTVSQPAYEIGRVACEMFINRRNNPNLPLQSITLLPRLVIRDSTKNIEIKMKGG